MRARRRWNRCGLCAQSWWDFRSSSDLFATVGGAVASEGFAAGGSSRKTTAARYRQYWPFYRSSVSAPLWTGVGVKVVSIRKRRTGIDGWPGRRLSHDFLLCCLFFIVCTASLYGEDGLGQVYSVRSTMEAKITVIRFRFYMESS